MTDLVWAVCGATLLSGFFALASYCLREFRRVQLEEAFGPGGARRLALLEKHLGALRLTAAFCRSLANLVLVVSMLFLLDAYQGGATRVAIAMAASWAVLAVFGESIPHAWAYAAGERVLVAILEILLAFRWMLWPIIALLQVIDVPIRRLSGTDREMPPTDVAKQEIMEAASEGKAEGAVNADEVCMIESVIGFGQRRSGEIMTPRTDIFALPLDTPWDQACQLIFQGGHTRVPIYEGDLDNIVGILYAKDLLQYVGTGQGGDLRTILRKPYFVPETKRLDDLLREFKARKVHLAVVLDEYGGTAGLVSFEDVLEEIVGDISDEYDSPEPAPVKRINEATVEVDGRMTVKDLNKALELDLPEDADYDTIAGFLFSKLGYIPSAGETLEWHKARFHIAQADERRIMRVRIETLPGKRQAQ